MNPSLLQSYPYEKRLTSIVLTRRSSFKGASLTLKYLMASKNSQAWCQKNEVKNKVWIFSLFLAVLFRAINLFGDLLFWLIHLRKEKVILPAFDDSLLLESATSLAKKIRTQKVSIILFKFLKLLFTSIKMNFLLYR